MTNEQAQQERFESWAIVELMGHRRLAGKVSEQQIAGSTLLRIDVPGPDDQVTTQYYSSGSIYCLTPTSEAIARAVAKRNQPQPVQPFELRELQQSLPALTSAPLRSPTPVPYDEHGNYIGDDDDIPEDDDEDGDEDEYSYGDDASDY